MKKTIGALAVLITISLSTHAQTTVETVSYMGAMKVDTVNGLQLMSFPFGGASINDLGLTNGVGGSTAATADNIHVYTPGVGYQDYFYLGYVGSPAYDYKWVDSSFQIATNVYPASSAFWYRSRSESTVTNLMSGAVPIADSTAVQISEGLQLIAWPYSTEMDINSVGLTNGVGGSTAATADNIHVYTPGEGYQDYYYLGYVGSPAYDYKWVDSSFQIANEKISPAAGVWYRCRKSGGFTWTLDRPYLND